MTNVFNVEDLKSMKVKDLRKLCAGKGIPKYWELKKDDLISELESYYEKEKENQKKKEEKKKSYIDGLKPGMLIAYTYREQKKENKTKDSFKLRTVKKMNTAKVVEVYKAVSDTMLYKEGGFVIAENAHKEIIKVGFDDICWVKTGTRWPKDIYKILKSESKEVLK